MSVYIVKSGDVLSRIAAANRTTVAELQRLNPSITNPNNIAVGQRITLPSLLHALPYPSTAPQLTVNTPGVSVSPVSGFWNGFTNLLNTAASVAPAVHGAILQNQANKQAAKQINEINMERARQGLAPIQQPVAAPGEMAPPAGNNPAKTDWMSYLPWAIGGGALLWLINQDPNS